METKGSTPREAGAYMLVSAHEQTGTIGGGHLEWICLEQARELLGELSDRALETRVVLGPEVNQCCGGVVFLRFEIVADLGHELQLLQDEEAAWPGLTVFGAGHVGRALVRAAVFLPISIRWIDARQDEFGIVPSGVTAIVSDKWEDEINLLKKGDGVLVLTQSHTLDAMITAAALERGNLAYVGMIGSRTKRRRFESAFRDAGLEQAQIDRLVCPIGDRGVKDKRPEIIAALTVAELAVSLVLPPEGDEILRQRKTIRHR